MAVGYWKEAMDTNSPLVSDLTERLQAITDEFDSVLGDQKG